MSKYLNIAQIVISTLLIIGILLQSRGSGLSAIFGGEGNIYRTKRGLEKSVFIATIILAVIFLALGVTSLLINR